ncbi:hypothetical protein D3C79_695760 [compost metagenome]
MVHDLLGRALGDDLPTVNTGAWADIDHVVGQPNGVLVVFHHDHRVAQVAQMVQGGQQAVVVALMKADGRFIEDVHHPHQTGADLAGESDTLRFTAGQGVGATIQGQVVEADIDQELKSFADFLEDFCRDFATPPSKGQLTKVVAGFTDRQIGYRRQGFLAHPHMARLAAQARTPAIRARLRTKEFGQFFTHGGRFGFAVAALKVRHNAFERVRALDDVASVVEVFEVDTLLAAALQDHFLVFG